jgi:ACS family tartrate transporter-like MFS transporter
VTAVADEVREESSTEVAVTTKVAWRILPLITLMYLFSIIDRANVGFAALSMNKELGLEAAAFGVGAGLFFLGYFVFEVPANLLFLRRLGARIWLSRILISWGLLSAATAFVSTPSQFYVLRFLLGVAEAGFLPCIVIYLAAWFPNGLRSRITAAMFISFPLANLIIGPISTYMLKLTAFSLHGWQLMFLVEGLPTALLGFATLLWLSDTPSTAKWLSATERKVLEKLLSTDCPAPHHHSLRDGFVSPIVWSMAAVLFLSTVGIWGFMFWAPQLLKALAGVSNESVGLLMVLPNLVAMGALVLFSRHSDRYRERRLHTACALLLAAAGFVLSFQSTNLTWIMASFCLIASGLYSSAPIFWSIPSTVLAGSAAMGGIAIVNSFGNLGGYAGPYLIGRMRESTEGFAASLTALAMSLSVAAAILILAPSLGGSHRK